MLLKYRGSATKATSQQTERGNFADPLKFVTPAPDFCDTEWRRPRYTNRVLGIGLPPTRELGVARMGKFVTSGVGAGWDSPGT